MMCRHDDPQPVVLPITEEHVGYVCPACYASLPAWFGCGDCETDEVVTFGGVHVQSIVTMPCAVHREAVR